MAGQRNGNGECVSNRKAQRLGWASGWIVGWWLAGYSSSKDVAPRSISSFSICFDVIAVETLP